VRGVTASPAARAELELLEQGQVFVDDECLALELLERVHRYGVVGRSEPIGAGDQFRVTLHAAPGRRPSIDIDLFATIKRAGELAHRPSPLLEVLP